MYTIITATDLARHTGEILNKVAGSRETMGIERNHIVVAKIVPSEQTMTAAQALAGLTFPILTLKQATTWLKDSKSKFGETVSDPWA